MHKTRHCAAPTKHLTLKNYVALRTKTKSERQDARGIRQVDVYKRQIANDNYFESVMLYKPIDISIQFLNTNVCPLQIIKD